MRRQTSHQPAQPGRLHLPGFHGRAMAQPQTIKSFTQQCHSNADTSDGGWFTDPDNIGFDPMGRLWICTDGVQPTGHDGLCAMDLEGPARALPKLFYAPPAGGECCSPAFIDNGHTLLLAIQHPGEGVSSLEDVPTRWPDFDPGRPPRSSIVAISHKSGRPVGT